MTSLLLLKVINVLANFSTFSDTLLVTYYLRIFRFEGKKRMEFGFINTPAFLKTGLLKNVILSH